jgi:hypothetical protein
LSAIKSAPKRKGINDIKIAIYQGITADIELYTQYMDAVFQTTAVNPAVKNIFFPFFLNSSFRMIFSTAIKSGRKAISKMGLL